MKLSVKKKELIFYAVVVFASILFFAMVGESGYYEYSDSWQYMELTDGEGIVPAYPLFIQLHRMILGDARFLYGVVVSQTIFTIACLLGYIIWIRKRFAPGYVVTVFIYLVALVPFTLDFPTVLVNHTILTEALAYPLFYIFAIFFVETMIRKSYLWIGLTGLTGMALALIRTQMQICFAFTALVFLYVVWRKGVGKKRIFKFVSVLAAIIGCIGIIAICEVAYLQISGRLQAVLTSCRSRMISEATIGDEQLEAEEAVPQKDIAKEVEESNIGNVTGQFDSVLMGRTFYEMDGSDIDLFDDPEVRELFSKCFEKMEEEKVRYVYAREGLWKWKDIMGGTGAGGRCMYEGWLEYLDENPESELRDPMHWQQVSRQISFALLKKHWPRMLYHTLCILPQGFICTVFFQKENIYALCHLYTLIIYLIGIIITIWGFLKKDIPEERREFILGILTLNIGMVVVISVIFFGMQRYLIYGFGIFYAALLLMLEQFFKIYGRTIWKKIRSRF